MNSRKELDDEIKERRSEVQLQERRILQKEENLENKLEQLEQREQNLQKKNNEVESKKSEIEETINKQKEELQRISRLSVEEAKQYLLSEVEKSIVTEKAELIRRLDEEAKEKAGNSGTSGSSYLRCCIQTWWKINCQELISTYYLIKRGPALLCRRPF